MGLDHVGLEVSDYSQSREWAESADSATNSRTSGSETAVETRRAAYTSPRLT